MDRETEHVLETFTEMRDRLMDVHGWCRKIATLATRFYLLVDNNDDLRARTQTQIVAEGVNLKPDLSLKMAREIVMLR